MDSNIALRVIENINSDLNKFVWGPYMLFLLVGTGIYLSIRTKFPQFFHFGHVLKNTIGKIINRGKAQKGAMTPFQALSTALASTVGVGNIAGVTGALILGGPGSIFWMWISGLFGMCTKFSEVTLAIHYREKNEKGDWIGGPMYYIKNGLGSKWKYLGIAFALFGAIAALGIGNLTQINSIAEQVVNVINAFSSNPIPSNTEFTVRLITGIIISILAGFVLIGGISSGIHTIQDNMVVGSMVHQFHIDCIAPETHRTMDNEHYYYDYDDIAHYIETMGDFDIGLYLFNQNTNDYQTERVLQYTDYETMDEYLGLHNWESTDQWRDDMRNRILAQQEISNHQAELAQMNEEHHLEDSQVTTLGGAK